MTEGDRTWSPLPGELSGNVDAQKARATAIAEAVVADDVNAEEVEPGRAKSAADANQKLVDTLTTITTGGIDRARDGAKFVQTAATAISGLYTGVLGVLFVNDQAAPTRSFIPMLFLGLAVWFATYYLAFVVPGRGMWPPKYEFNQDRDMWIRLNYVSRWVRRIVFPRADALRAAVMSLFFGLVLLPIGFVELPSELRVPGLPAPVPAEEVEINWPEPTILPNSALTTRLYEAQLEEFREGLPSGAAGTDTSARDDAIAVILLALGLLVVIVMFFNPRGWWRPSEDIQQVVGPDARER